MLFSEKADLFDIANFPEPKKFKSHMASSYDREGGNFDYGNFELIQGEEAVALDVDGPGIITRIWSANAGGRIRIYLDGSGIPTIDEEFAGFLNRLPLSYGNGVYNYEAFDAQGGVVPGDEARGRTSYMPIPFQNGCKITFSSDQSWLYYHVNYLLSDEPHGLPTFTPEDIDSGTSQYEKIESILSWQAEEAAPRFQVEKGTVSLKPGERTTIFDRTGALTIRSLKFKLSYPGDEMQANHVREKLQLRGYWDADAHADGNLRPNRIPSIKTPLAYFFMDYGYAEYYDTAMIRKAGQTYEARFPMPVRERSVLELVNTSCITVQNIEYELVYEPDAVWTDQTAHFKAIYHAEDSTFGCDLGNYRDKVMYLGNTSEAYNYPLLRAWGTGTFVGCNFHIDFAETPFPRAIGESDEAVLVDDAPTLTMWGTGNEDYINDAWGFHSEMDTLAGSNCVGNTKTGYRFHISDCIPFTKKIAFTFEHGSSNNCTAIYKSVAYFYQQPDESNIFVDGVPDRRMGDYFRI